jgi:S-adenosylmethionine:tRNA ribosyltransferase-isomerase
MAALTPFDIRISDYYYELPDERIAHYPLENRDASKLLVWQHQQISESVYSELPSHIPSGSRLVFNNTRVIPARLYFQEETGATVEIFLLEPVEEERITGTPEPGTATWNCLVGKAGKWKHGQVLTAMSAELELWATIVGKEDKNFIIRFSWNKKAVSFFDVVRQLGNIPLPPYIKRKPESSDLERYQTVYAQQEGSVAAPTAGLHFTPELLASLQANNISLEYLTLHVGAGTFLPVKSETMAGHSMHAEWMDLDIRTIEDLANYAGDLFAVGTTSLRTLESLYWMGVKLLKNPELAAGELPVRQWEVYETISEATRKEALIALADWMRRQSLSRLVTTTEILIAPPYKIRMIAGLITNFHQPNSTLLLLIAAITGERWRVIYNYALANDFRFLSYGDGCLLYVE